MSDQYILWYDSKSHCKRRFFATFEGATVSKSFSYEESKALIMPMEQVKQVALALTMKGYKNLTISKSGAALPDNPFESTEKKMEKKGFSVIAGGKLMDTPFGIKPDQSKGKADLKLVASDGKSTEFNDLPEEEQAKELKSAAEDILSNATGQDVTISFEDDDCPPPTG